jgi:beta-catenin-like protein 1
MASEADLDADIKAFSILSEHTELYEEFVRLGCVASLVSLLAHENTDVAIDVIEILGELTDEDTGADESQWRTLVNAMLEADVVDLLTQNLTRLDEASETDRNGAYHVLRVIENLSSQTDNADRIGQKSNMFEWLLNRVQQKEKAKVSQNTQYAAEILAILLQASSLNRRKFAAMDGVDALLQLLSGYRKRDPEKDSDEEEYVENLFDSLTCLVDEGAGKGKFLEAEGVELCLIMLREGKMSKFRALRVFDHVLGGVDQASSCERFVTAAGLKTVFGMFMKKQDKGTMEHLLGVFSSLLRFLPGGSAARIRTLAKFMEKDYEKIAKLVALRKEYTAQVLKVEREVDEEKKAIGAEDAMDMEAEFLSRRLDAGLFPLQTLDVILAWLVAEDDGARLKVGELMGGGNEGSILLKSSLQKQLDEMDADAEDRTSAKAILQALIDCL